MSRLKRHHFIHQHIAPKWHEAKHQRLQGGGAADHDRARILGMKQLEKMIIRNLAVDQLREKTCVTYWVIFHSHRLCSWSITNCYWDT